VPGDDKKRKPYRNRLVQVVLLNHETMSPDRDACQCVQQLNVDSDATAGALQTAAYEKLGAELLRDELIGQSAVPIGKRRAACNDEQRSEAGKRGDQVLDDTVDGVRVFLTRQVVERQHGHGEKTVN
jgi:hypothetical protein